MNSKTELMEVDLRKARTFFDYLSTAAKKYHEREVAREKLQIQIQKLKGLSTKSLRGHINELEKRLEESLAKEKKLEGYQKQEDVFHRQLKEKIARLEKKLGRYLETREGRLKRIVELENKIKQKTATRNEKASLVLAELGRLERIYREARKGKRVSRKRLDSIRRRISLMKKRVGRLA